MNGSYFHAKQGLIFAALALQLNQSAVWAQEQSELSDASATSPPAPETDVRTEQAFLAATSAASFAPATTLDASALDKATSLDTVPASVQDDMLDVGGLFYLRANGTVNNDDGVAAMELNAPMLMDAYFDARPHDRLRGMALGRINYNPTQVDSATVFLLNQLWLRFDLGHRFFITTGKQHSKWGTASIWNPTDFLQSEKRDPLEPFDYRAGVAMVKVHVPWEKRGWNFYGIGVYDSAAALSGLSGALRGEIVVKTMEMGFDLVAKQDSPLKLGLDFSAGLGPVDVYGEAALQHGTAEPLWRESTATGSSFTYETYAPDGWLPAVSTGVQWSHSVFTVASLTVGAEYFYNGTGYADASIYPWLMAEGDFEPFYVGQHYAGIYGLMMGPSNWNYSTIGFFNLANLSDQSFVSRLNFSTMVLSQLTFEVFGAIHYGNQGGEFRYGTTIPAHDEGGTTVPESTISPPLVDLGAGLKVKF